MGIGSIVVVADLLEARSGWNCLFVGSLFVDCSFMREEALEYDARIVQSDATLFSREDGLPLEYNVVYEKVSQAGLRW